MAIEGKRGAFAAVLFLVLLALGLLLAWRTLPSAPRLPDGDLPAPPAGREGEPSRAPRPAPPPGGGRLAGDGAPPPEAPDPRRLEARLVFEGDGANPGAGVAVTFAGGKEPLRAATDGAGGFVLEGLPGPGPHGLLLEGDALGVGKQWVRVEVPPDGAAATVPVGRRWVLRGLVKDARGLPAAKAEASLRAGSERGTRAVSVPTGADGTFRIEVEDEPTSLAVGALGVPGSAPAPGRVTQVSRYLREVLVEMPAGPVIRGRVVDGEGRPLPPRRVEFVVAHPEGETTGVLLPLAFTAMSTLYAAGEDGGRGLRHRMDAWTDGSGVFRLTPFLPAARVVLWVEREGCPPAVRVLRDLAAGDHGEIDVGDLRLAPPVRPLRVRLVLPDGRPATGIPVSFSLLPGEGLPFDTIGHSHGVTDADGWIASPFLEEGASYRFLAGTQWEGPTPAFTATDGIVLELDRVPVVGSPGHPGGGGK